MIKTGHLSEPYKGITDCFARTIKDCIVIVERKYSKCDAVLPNSGELNIFKVYLYFELLTSLVLSSLFNRLISLFHKKALFYPLGITDLWTNLFICYIYVSIDVKLHVHFFYLPWTF